MPALTLPPFPDNVPTHPLLVVDYKLIEKRDPQELGKLYQAATELGFWYLKNHGVDDLVNSMFEMGEATMNLPLDEKMKFEQGDDGRSFGYKASGANAVDEAGTLDFVEFINVSKDDALAYPNPIHRTYPSTVNDHMKTTITPFVEESLRINNTILDVLNNMIGLPPGTIAQLHPRDEASGSETRCIKNPPKPNGFDPKLAVLGAHSDFGSLSFLHNRLGGLQVLVPGSEEWQYIRPIPGHAICNLGDAMKIFSGGILRSNLHRVVPPPGQQAMFDRWSVVFFSRPANSAVLRPLVNESVLVAEAVKKNDAGIFDTGSTAAAWFSRRIKNQRTKNRTGPETWRASRGTEHKPEVS